MYNKLIVDIYTGLELKSYVSTVLKNISESRDFVRAINEYVDSSETRVLMISGLRGTGKTIGILQAIRNINDYDNTVFINIDAEADMNCLDLRRLIESGYANKKYVFVDEVTRVKDLVSNSGFLADRLCNSGIKVILSGTDSLSLIKSEGSGLYHRAINKNVTHISFTEAQRTANQSFKEYMEMGGLYKADAIKDLDGLRQYIDTAVVDNILNTFNKNKVVSSMLSLETLVGDPSKLRTIVFRIIYSIIYVSAKGITNVNVNYVINLFNHSDSDLYDIKSLNSLVCAQMGVDEYVKTSEKEVALVLGAMSDLDLVVKLDNIYQGDNFQYYITNPSIVNQLLYAMVSLLDNTGLKRKSNASLKSFRGKIFESIVVTHTKLICDKLGYGAFYYHDNRNRELDLVIRNELSDEFGDTCVCYEIKLTNDVDTAVVKSRWINDTMVNAFIEVLGSVKERGIIYSGSDAVFKGFTSEDVYPPTNMTLEEIESQNLGVKLFSVETYLSDIKNILKAVLD